VTGDFIMNVLQPQEPSLSNPDHRLRLWPLPVILLSAGGVLWGLQSGTFSLTTRPSADFIYIIWSFQAIIFVWLMFLSRLGPIARVKWLLTILAIQLCLYLTIGVDGYAGDGRAILAWRWSVTPEERLAISLRDRRTVENRDQRSVDLKTTTPLDSPAFRGRDRLGIVQRVRLARNWEVAAPKQLWRHPIGRGWSSFAVVGNYCVTQEQRSEDEVVACYELKTGRESWTHRDPARFFEVSGDGGPRATPTIHHGRVYTLGATGILNCLDGATGKRIWSVDVLKSNNVSNRLFGMVGSPLVIDEMVIVSPGAKQSSLVAYDIEDGRKLWGGGSAEASYSSPQFAELAGRRQILNFNGEGLFAHAVTDGHVLWSYPWVSNPTEKNNVCHPVIRSGWR
jgi:outer membrane protein assembly factor BamB